MTHENERDKPQNRGSSMAQFWKAGHFVAKLINRPFWTHRHTIKLAKQGQDCYKLAKPYLVGILMPFGTENCMVVLSSMFVKSFCMHVSCMGP